MQANRQTKSKHSNERVAVTGKDLQELRNLSRNIYSNTLKVTYSPIGVNIEQPETLLEPFGLTYSETDDLFTIGSDRTIDNPALISLGGYSELITEPETIGSLSSLPSITQGYNTLVIDINYVNNLVQHAYRWITASQLTTLGISGKITIPLATVKKIAVGNQYTCLMNNYQRGHLILPVRFF